jgi:hypothetical protein
MKACFLVLATVAFISLSAQTYEQVRDLAGKNQWIKAKEGIDKYLQDAANAQKGEGWYLKAVIYNSIARDSLLGIKFPDARMSSFNSYKKYLELDKEAYEGKSNQHATLFDVSFGYLAKAGKDFETRNFLEALEAFRNAEIIQTYIQQKGFIYNNFSFPAFDTQLYVNIAASAINAKKEAIAVQYYARIADKKIQAPGYEEIYRYLVNHYDQQKDRVNRDKYLAIGKTLYPGDNFLCQVGLLEIWQDKKKLFSRYEDLINSGCSNYINNYNYAVELYNYCFAQSTRPEDCAKSHPRIGSLLKTALGFESTVEATMLMCRYQFGLISDLLEQHNAIKGGDAESMKKKADLMNQINAKYDAMIPFASKAFQLYSNKDTLTNNERKSFRTVASMILEYWEVKKDTARVEEARKLIKVIDEGRKPVQGQVSILKL